MKLFIGCSASNDIPSEYYEDCKVFLEGLMKENDLVFGACNSGLMGLAYNTTLNAGRKVIGVCPEAYKDDFKDLRCDVEITTKSVSERTDSVISESDALIFLPGGIGTIYELTTAIESKRCHEFDKPIVIYNCNGYYNKLLDFLQQIYSEKFAKEKDRMNYFVSDSLPEIKFYLNNYERIRKTERRLGVSYTLFSDEYRRTNGFTNIDDVSDVALMQSTSPRTTQQDKKTYEKVKREVPTQ